MTENNNSAENLNDENNNSNEDEANNVELTTEQELEKALEDVKHWKAMSRKNENAFKEIKPLADSWTDYQKSQKPKEQQLEEELQALKNSIAEKETQHLISTIGMKSGLPEEAFEYITGNTAEEVEASVNKLKTVFGIDDAKNEKQNPPVAPNPLQGFVSKPAVKEESELLKALRKASENLNK